MCFQNLLVCIGILLHFLLQFAKLFLVCFFLPILVGSRVQNSMQCNATSNEWFSGVNVRPKTPKMCTEGRGAGGRGAVRCGTRGAGENVKCSEECNLFFGNVDAEATRQKRKILGVNNLLASYHFGLVP